MSSSQEPSKSLFKILQKNPPNCELLFCTLHSKLDNKIQNIGSNNFYFADLFNSSAAEHSCLVSEKSKSHPSLMFTDSMTQVQCY